MAGQSNAVGQESDASLLPQPHRTAAFWWDEPGVSNSGMKWGTLTPQPGGFKAGHFGPEFGIAAAVNDAAIFKFASGSTSLANDWKPGSNSGLLQRMQDELKVAMQQMPTAAPYCFVFVQGESDAETAPMANEYERRLRALITAVRGEIGQNVPVVLSVDELHPWVKENPHVVAAQKAIAATVPNTAFSSFSDLPKADKTHLIASSTLEQGRRLAAACGAGKPS